MLDGIQIGRVRRQEEHRGPRGGDERVGKSTFVEGRIVHNHDLGVVQEWTEFPRQPGIEERRVVGARKQERGGKGLSAPGGEH